MDNLFTKGLTEIFLAISLNVKEQFKISSKSSHLDSSSLHVHGKYDTSLPDVVIDNISEENQIKTPQTIEITYGYSRDLQFPQKNGAALNIENTPTQRYHACNKAAPFFKVPSRTIDQI